MERVDKLVVMVWVWIGSIVGSKGNDMEMRVVLKMDRTHNRS